MTADLGQLTLRGLGLSIVVCVVLGIAIYRQFGFEQKAPQQEATAAHLNDVEKKVDDLRTKLEQTEKALSQISQKTTTQCEPAKAASGKHR